MVSNNTKENKDNLENNNNNLKSDNNMQIDEIKKMKI